MFAIMIWWVVDARKWFKGPKVNVDHLMLDREDQKADLQGAQGEVLDGKPVSEQDRSSEEHVDGTEKKQVREEDAKSHAR